MKAVFGPNKVERKRRKVRSTKKDYCLIRKHRPTSSSLVFDSATNDTRASRKGFLGRAAPSKGPRRLLNDRRH